MVITTDGASSGKCGWDGLRLTSSIYEFVRKMFDGCLTVYCTAFGFAERDLVFNSQATLYKHYFDEHVWLKQSK